MSEEYLNNLVKRYQDYYDQLAKKLKWKVSDKRFNMMIASVYVVNDNQLNIERFLQISDYIKDNVGMFSTLKSSQRFTTAAMLDNRFEKPEEKFHEFMDIYEQFVNGGFSRGAFTYISALVLLTNDSDNNNNTTSIERSMEMYKGMRKKHMFLTSSGDYPLAVLLAQIDRSIDKLLERTEVFYNGMAERGFRKGNDLQFLSHILTIEENSDADALMERCIQIFDRFQQGGQRVKPMYYPAVGLLALLPDGLQEVERVLALSERLKQEKQFKWNKDLNFIISANLLVSEKIQDASLIETGLHTTIETIIQAQQAAMVAVVASTSAAAAASSN